MFANMGKSTTRADLGKCPDCGANLNLVGFAHNCKPLPERLAEVAVKKAIDATPKRLKIARAAVRKLSSHPDCPRCNADRDAAKERMRKKRAKT